MTNLYYYVIFDERTKEERAALDTFEKYNNDTWNPYTRKTCLIQLNVSGRTYNERKKDLQQKAIEYLLNQAPGLYWSDVAIIQDFFETCGRRYGLLKEFRENAIC